MKQTLCFLLISLGPGLVMAQQKPANLYNDPVTLAANTTIQSPPAPTTRQAITDRRISIGLRAGRNWGTVSRADIDNLPGAQPEYAPGFHGGFIMNIGGPVFSIQPEILFNQYNFRYSINQTTNTGFAEGNINMIDVPVLLKASFGSSNARFFLNAGPYGTFFINGKVNGRVSVGSREFSLSGPIERENFGKRFGYGVTGGLGLALRLGPGDLLLEGRYNYLAGYAQEDNTEKTKAKLFMASLGYLIPLGGR
ncbi:hypothetical protein GCM10023189_13860 [Nibrella saemangeumensis]|uniref:Outer membrane protein beta-barrel domain-containing protein n=1 Tax=Nibrella saemangeumensis TaxID=1084526 RepID=A0ABP8MJV3_9BACT